MTESLRTSRTWFITGAVRHAGAMSNLLADYPNSAWEILLDVRDAASVTVAMDHTARIFGGLDVVVNNVGAGFVGAIEEVTELQARDHLDLNLFGPLWVSQAALPHLRARGGGDIVQNSTVGAIGSMPTFGLYNAGKWALEGFSEALSTEVAQFGIHVTIADSRPIGPVRACSRGVRGPPGFLRHGQ